jgi:DNA topoisomerase VI subunit B
LTKVKQPLARVPVPSIESGRIASRSGRASNFLPNPLQRPRADAKRGFHSDAERHQESHPVAVSGDEFSRVGRKKKALGIIEHVGKRLSDRSHPRHIARAQATALHRALQETRVLAPQTTCIAPIGEKQLLEGLHKELKAGFCTVITRPPAAYRGNPFQAQEIAMMKDPKNPRQAFERQSKLLRDAFRT